ncbi:MAG: CBS domain-containing protein [Candidatus Nitrosotenuis sp.]
MATTNQFTHISKIHDTVDNIKNVNVISIQKDDSIYDAMLNLTTAGISKIFVFDKKKPIGIITDKDIIRFLFIDKSGRDIHEITSQEIMNNILFTIGSITCQQAAHIMLINKLSTLGIGTCDKLDGIITKTDLLQYYVNCCHDKYKVYDYMTISYFSASVNDKLYQIIKLMATCDISRVVVVDEARRPVGIITNGDIFRATMETFKMNIVQSSKSNYSDQDGLWSETGFVGSQITGDIMTEGIIAVNSTMDMRTAAKIILNKKIDSLGINDNDGNLIGLVNKTNILHALAKSGGD